MCTEVDVVSFGAIGDGVTDNTVAFQNALDSLVSTGGKLVIPPGDYVISSELDSSLRKPVILKGTKPTLVEGYGATLRKTTNSTFRAMFVSNIRCGAGLTYGSGACNYTFRGIRFESTFAIGGACIFAMNSAQNFLIEDCVFWQVHANAGHVMDLGGCDRWTIRNCDFYGYQQITDGIEDNIAEAIQCDMSQKGAMTSGVDPGTPVTNPKCTGLMSRDITVDHCRFLPLFADGVLWPCSNPFGNHGYVENRYLDRLRFTNNYVLDPPQGSPKTDVSNDSASNFYRGVFHFPSARDLRFTGNTIIQTVSTGRWNRVITLVGKASGNIENQDFNVFPPTAGQWSRPNQMRDILIEKNVFSGFKVSPTELGHDVIYVKGVDAPDGEVLNLKIVNNVFRDGFNGTIKGSSNGSAIYLEDVRGGVVEGNQVSDYLTALKLMTCRGVSIRGNNSRNTAHFLASIQLSSNVTYQNNTADTFGKEITVGNTNDTIISGNVFTTPTSTGNEANAIVLVSGDGIVCVGNVIHNDTGAIQPRGMALGSNLVNSIVKDNVVLGYSTKVAGAPSPTTIFVQ